MRWSSAPMICLVLKAAATSALSPASGPKIDFGAALESIDGFDHGALLFSRSDGPQFDTFQKYVNFASTSASTSQSSQPYTFSKKCSQAPHPDVCVSCAGGTNAVLASGLTICSVRYGQASWNDPIGNVPKLAACAAVSTGLWFSNMVGCVNK